MCARALEMPFSSTFSAAAGVTKLLRGWDVAQRLARLALSNVAERGIVGVYLSISDVGLLLGSWNVWSSRFCASSLEIVLFIGTRFSNLYT